MNNPGIARFTKQLAAETLANDLTLKSLASVPEHGRHSGAFQRASQLLPHNQIARRVWLCRLKGEKPEMPKDWFPSWTPEETRGVCAELDAAWATYLSTITDADLARETQYTSSEGKRYTSLVEDILIHVFNHSTYHRGQIARLVTECGGERAGTDYIAFRRTAL